MKTTKSIGIITFHRAINYGAVWQCFALSKFLSGKGYDVSVIDYFPDFLMASHKKLPKRLHNFLIKFFIIPKFKKFVSQKLPISKTFYGISEIMNDPPLFDAYICGSDQIWNTELVGRNLPVYLLAFAPEGSKKIAYSASIGGKPLKERDLPTYEKYLKEFQAISVREVLAQSEVEKIDHIKPEIVLDPSLLLTKEDYLPFISNRFKGKKYILIIDLEKNNLLKSCAEKLSKETGLKILNISGAHYSYAKNPLGISPEDWLSAIYNAEYVCVNSFHGLTYSIVFEKQFFYIERDVKDKNNRANGLLESLSLDWRYIRNVSEIILENKINFSDTLFQNSIKSLKNNSFQFLDKINN